MNLMMFACKAGHIEVVQLLLAAGIDLEQQVYSGNEEQVGQTLCYILGEACPCLQSVVAFCSGKGSV